MSNEKLCIAIPVHGRIALADQCIPTVAEGCAGNRDWLDIFVDGDSPLPAGRCFVGVAAGAIEHAAPTIGIERQRRLHFEKFVRLPSDFTHLYLTDADAPHDPNWRSELLRIQAAHGGAPVCGYNTAAHANMVGNTIGEEGEVIWRKFAPGVSYLLTREHVEKVVRWLKAHPEVHHWHFDWQVPAILGHRFAVTKTSYVEHIGVGGMHHPADVGYEGGDRALNPTPAVAKLRAEIVAKLISK